MSNPLRITSLARATALSLALIVPVAATAYADDEYGTQHETVIGQAASSIPSAPLSLAQSNALIDTFKVGQNDAFDASRSPRLAPVAQNYMGRLASGATAGKGTRDLVGAGCAQDEPVDAIYPPGSG